MTFFSVWAFCYVCVVILLSAPPLPRIYLKTSYQLYSGYYLSFEMSPPCAPLHTVTLPSLPSTFGQAEPWEVSTHASWKHPWVPYKILIDPQSLPIHLVLEGGSSVLQVLNSDQRPKARGKAVPEVCAQAEAFPCATGKVSSACTLPSPVKQAMETRWCT